MTVTSNERRFQRLLNTVTDKRFAEMLPNLDQIQPTNPTQLTKLAETLFRRCIDEPMYSEVYSRIAAHIIEKDPTETFRRILMERCSQLSDQSFTRTQHEDSILRANGLSNMKMMAEFYKHNLMDHHQVTFLAWLYLRHDTEHSIDCVVKLLTIAGSKLTTEIDDTALFASLKDIQTDQRYSTRLRFLILDLLELRQRGWSARNESSHSSGVLISLQIIRSCFSH